MIVQMNIQRIFIASWLICLLAVFPAYGRIVYVDANAKGGNTGADWANAATNLAAALRKAAPAAEVWLAEGVYIPGTKHSDSFVLKPGMKLLGGFAGGMGSREARNWTAHPTILSGNIGRQGKSDCVVKGAANAIIDGVTIQDGGAPGHDNPHDPAYPSKVGGLLVRAAGSDALTIANCTFRAVCRLVGRPHLDALTIANCTFRANDAYYDTSPLTPGLGYGGAILALNSSIIVVDSVFDDTRSHTGG